MYIFLSPISPRWEIKSLREKVKSGRKDDFGDNVNTLFDSLQCLMLDNRFFVYKVYKKHTYYISMSAGWSMTMLQEIYKLMY